MQPLVGSTGVQHVSGRPIVQFGSGSAIHQTDPGQSGNQASLWTGAAGADQLPTVATGGVTQGTAFHSAICAAWSGHSRSGATNQQQCGDHGATLTDRRPHAPLAGPQSGLHATHARFGRTKRTCGPGQPSTKTAEIATREGELVRNAIILTSGAKRNGVPRLGSARDAGRRE